MTAVEVKDYGSNSMLEMTADGWGREVKAALIFLLFRDRMNKIAIQCGKSRLGHFKF